MGRKRGRRHPRKLRRRTLSAWASSSRRSAPSFWNMSACTKRAAARAAVSGFMRTSRQMLVFRDRQAASAMSSLIGLLAVRRSRPPAANLFLSLHTRHTWASAQGTLERAHGRPASPSADPTPPPAAPRTSAAPAPPPPPPPAAAAAARGSARRVGAPVKVKERRRLCLIAPVVGSQSRSAPRNRAAQRPNAASLPTRPGIRRIDAANALRTRSRLAI